jgi:hypothetical protein
VLGDVVIENSGTVKTNVAYAPSVTGVSPIYEFAADGSTGNTQKIDDPKQRGT